MLRRATAERPSDRFPSVRGVRRGVEPGDARSATTSATETWSSSAGVNPYVGLRSFGEADSALFFGRDELADSLAAAVRSSPFVAVVGASGSGKSSLVHAGLVPRLRRAGRERRDDGAGKRPGGAVAHGAARRRYPGASRRRLESFVAAVAAQCGGRLDDRDRPVRGALDDHRRSHPCDVPDRTQLIVALAASATACASCSSSAPTSMTDRSPTLYSGRSSPTTRSPCRRCPPPGCTLR